MYLCFWSLWDAPLFFFMERVVDEVGWGAPILCRCLISVLVLVGLYLSRRRFTLVLVGKVVPSRQPMPLLLASKRRAGTLGC